MIIDYRTKDRIAHLFHVIDLATGQPIDKDRPYFYADDDRAIVRAYDRDENGKSSGNLHLRHAETRSRLVERKTVHKSDGLDHYFETFANGVTCEDAPLEVAWTEYYLPIRIEPRPDLDDGERAMARRAMREFNEANDPPRKDGHI